MTEERQPWVQRVIRGFFATREYGILFLILVCITVEVGVLFVTQQYESMLATQQIAQLKQANQQISAVADEVGFSVEAPMPFLVFGMTMGGLAFFLVELMKLPLAWAAGTQTGYLRIVFNAFVILVCVISVVTLKDMVTADWQLALRGPDEVLEKVVPSRDLRITNLNEDLRRLETSGPDTEQRYLGFIEKVNAEIKISQAERAAEDGRLEDQLAQVRTSGLDEPTRQQIESAKLSAIAAKSSLDEEIRSLELQIDAAIAEVAKGDSEEMANYRAEREAIQVERERRTAEHERMIQRNREEFEARMALYREELGLYDEVAREKESKVESARRIMDEKIKAAEEADSLFNQKGPKIRAAQEEFNAEVKRLEAAFGSRPRPVQPARTADPTLDLPPFPDPPIGSGGGEPSPQVEAIRARMTDLRSEKARIDADSTQRIELLLQGVQESPSERNARLEREQALKQTHQENVRRIEERIQELVEQKRGLEGELASVRGNPKDIAERATEIRREIERETQDRDRLRAEAIQARANTSPLYASLAVGWFMPDATDDERLKATFALVPLGLGLLAGLVPALALEFGTSSLRTPPRERSRWEVFRRFGRGSRALKAARTLTRKAEEQMAAAAILAREETRRIESEELLLRQRREAFEAEVASRRSGIEAEIFGKSAELQSELLSKLRDADSREVNLTERIVHLNDICLKQWDDIRTLAQTVVRYGGDEPKTKAPDLEPPASAPPPPSKSLSFPEPPDIEGPGIEDI